MNAIAMMCKDMEVVSIFNPFTGIPPESFFCIINRNGEVVKKIFSKFEMSFDNCVFVNNLTINIKYMLTKRKVPAILGLTINVKYLIY